MQQVQSPCCTGEYRRSSRPAVVDGMRIGGAVSVQAQGSALVHAQQMRLAPAGRRRLLGPAGPE